MDFVKASMYALPLGIALKSPVERRENAITEAETIPEPGTVDRLHMF
ncbi:MAG: hypothetical protein QXZ09_07835 [Candidatus Methanomethylicaceae archaeon]